MTKKPETVKEEDLIKRKDGLYYKKDAKVPFSGISEQFHKDQLGYRFSILRPFMFDPPPHTAGRFLTIKNYKNGKLHGSAETFYPNGKLRQKGNYINGELHGPYEGFHRNGQLGCKRNYKGRKKR